MAMPRDVVVLSDDQFNKLVELLTPGHKMASLFLDQHQREQDAASQFGGEASGGDIMNPGPQYTGKSEPGIDDASKQGGEGGDMGSGPQFTGAGQSPEPDDASEQGSG